jgi:uncharacterized OB-fold protein
MCLACGMQYAAAREDCPICEDERQYVPQSGQQWTNLSALRESGTYTGTSKARAHSTIVV